jgi:hypothetical protein
MTYDPLPLKHSLSVGWYTVSVLEDMRVRGVGWVRHSTVRRERGPTHVSCMFKLIDNTQYTV